MKFDIHKLVGFNEAQKAKLLECLQYGTLALSSEMFAEKVTNFTWTEYRRRWFKTYTYPHTMFHDTTDSNAVVLQKLLSGADTINRENDEDIDLFLTLYYKNNNVVGYTNGGNDAYINSKFFLNRLDTKEGMADIVNNVVHEYMHKVGYHHSYYGNSCRPYSVPYAVGDIAGETTLYFMNK